MPTPKEILCCLTTDRHIVEEPILLKCGGNACKKCILNSNEKLIRCFSCEDKHEQNDFINAKINETAELIISSSLGSLFEDLNSKFEAITIELKDETLIEDFKVKTEFVENEIDIRVESLISEIHKYRDDYHSQLNDIKDDFEKLVKENSVNKAKFCDEIKEVSYESLKKQEKELKLYEKRLNEYRESIKQIQFIPSSFKIFAEQFGKLLNEPNSSVILSDQEILSLNEMIKTSNIILLYRASKDGFTAEAFHLKCDGKEKTITIIKNNLDYVFGGYTSAKWSSDGKYKEDEQAFIFSLRRNGISCSKKFMISNPEEAIYGYEKYGPTFGGGHDFRIFNESNVKTGSYTNFGYSYEVCDCQIENSKNFLAGNYFNWLTTEIEVYQII